MTSLGVDHPGVRLIHIFEHRLTQVTGVSSRRGSWFTGLLNGDMKGCEIVRLGLLLGFPDCVLYELLLPASCMHLY